MSDRDWDRLAAYVAARMRALAIDSKAELQRRTTLSTPTIRGILNGKPRSGESLSDETLWKLDRGLSWAPDSSAAVAAGGEPVELAAPSEGGSIQPAAAEAARMEERLRAEIGRVEDRLEGFAAAFDEQLRVMVEAVERLAVILAEQDEPGSP